MIKSAKGVEVNKKNLFVTHIFTFGSNVLLAFWITKFNDVSLTKVFHFNMVKGMDKFYGGKNINQIIYFIDFYHAILKNA